MFALSRVLKAMIAGRKAAHSAQEKMGSVVPHEMEPAREPARRAAKDFEATALVQAAARREPRGRVSERDLDLAGFAACSCTGFGRYTARTGS